MKVFVGREALNAEDKLALEFLDKFKDVYCARFDKRLMLAGL
jgi:vacuolar-type H+-ATPase subunit B/Vma2